jgi:integrase
MSASQRAGELCDLRWSQVELSTGRLHVWRAKNGSPRYALSPTARTGPSSHVFVTEWGGPMTPKAFHVYLAGSALGPRCLSRFTRTCCGTLAAMPGQRRSRHARPKAWLGHKNW